MIVYKSACLYKGLLFVNSALMGKFETDKMWKQASLVDVYDYVNRAYVVSFYIYNINGERLNRFAVEGNNFYGLVGTHLVSYKMSPLVFKQYSVKDSKSKAKSKINDITGRLSGEDRKPVNRVDH